MKVNLVKSSNIFAIAYSRKNKIMTIVFRSGLTTYQYSDVPQHVYNKVLRAGSVGQSFNTLIKNKFSYSKVEGNK
jgi:hypothetical protein